MARDQVPTELTAWHLVGAKDALEEEDLTGSEPQDGYPVLLRDWIRSDGLRCLKIKLTGLDPSWDYRADRARGQYRPGNRRFPSDRRF